MSPALDIAVSTAAGPRVVDLARALADELSTSGTASSLFVDRLPVLAPGRVPCIVHPHPQFIERVAASRESVTPLLRRSVVACVGALDAASALVFREARATLALRPDAIQALRVAGLAPELWAAGRAEAGVAGEEDARDLDVVVCEGWTPERWRILASCARVLDGRSCDLRASYVGGTRAGIEHVPDGDGRRALYRRARIALIVGEGRSLDLLAALEAASSGAVVVTDARIDLAPFTAGVDIVSADAPTLPLVLDALLQDPARQAAVRAGAAALLRRSPLARAAAQLVRAAREPRATPRWLARPPAPIEPVSETGPRHRELATGLGTVLSEQRRQGRRLTQLEGHTADSLLTTTPGWAAANAELSVVIPLYDYERWVEMACRSAIAARDVAVEVVVVDDASRDDGAARVEALMASTPDAALALMRLPVNGGLSQARNAGASIARSPLVLFLDADDELLPHGPARLRDALARDAGAAFAYGLLSVESESGPEGLLNAEPWNPDLLRDGNYVNALALVRAEAYARVGGYRSDGPLELGWEDYDFWLRMAEAGLRGAHVRQLVARYRAHGASRTTTADEVAEELTDYLHGRYPTLFGEMSA